MNDSLLALKVISCCQGEEDELNTSEICILVVVTIARLIEPGSAYTLEAVVQKGLLLLKAWDVIKQSGY